MFFKLRVSLTDLIHCLVDLDPCQIFLEGLIELLVFAGDDNDLEVRRGFDDLMVDLQNVRNAEGACHDQHRGQLRIKALLFQKGPDLHRSEKFLFNGDAVGIETVLFDSPAEHLFHHFLAGNDIGIHALLDPPRVCFDERLPVAGGSRIRQRAGQLVKMAHRYGQRVRGIEELRVQGHLECFLHQQFHLFLGSIAPACNGHLHFSGRIFENRYLPMQAGGDGRSLRPPQFEHGLHVLAVKGGLNGQVIRGITVHQGPYSLENPTEFQEMILLLPEVDHAHIHIMDALFIYENDPVTKEIGSGVDAEYDPLRRCHQIRSKPVYLRSTSGTTMWPSGVW